ncbi:hypothetical protein VZC37_16480 [Gordonia sp. LSe1-13]|uniref:DUF202 domain-containing protein n=1 Tax=Gordonia sesuvii TaxID=3116777 RepID=A0ABU7MFN8_9ACTN|nr:hypothetical protein [Gordonia sp. LSe1-13]
MPTSSPTRTRWWRRLVATIGLVLLSWALGAAVVRVGLDLTDRLPYSPRSEWLYLLVAVCALAVSGGGSALAVRRHRRASGHRPPN